MSDDSLGRRIAKRLFGVRLELEDGPPVVAGYSVAHRVLAGMLGVRLLERQPETTGAATADPVLSSTCGWSPAEGLGERSSQSQSPLRDESAPLSVVAAEKRLLLRMSVIGVLNKLDSAASGVQKISDGWISDRTAILYDAIIRESVVGDLLASTSIAADRLMPTGFVDGMFEFSSSFFDHLLTVKIVPARDPGRVFESASHLVESLARGDELERARATEIAEARAVLATIATDFRAADLETVDIHDLSLVGVRWDVTTKWPPGWQAKIRRASAEEYGLPGVFVIRTQPGYIPESFVS